MKFNSGRSVLGLIIVLASISLFYFSSCKKDDSVATTLIVGTVDANNSPISGAQVVVYVDTSVTHIKEPAGFPKTQYTDATGQTTFNFPNGIVVLINASKGSLSEQSFGSLQPGATVKQTLQLIY